MLQRAGGFDTVPPLNLSQNPERERPNIHKGGAKTKAAHTSMLDDLVVSSTETQRPNAEWPKDTETTGRHQGRSDREGTEEKEQAQRSIARRSSVDIQCINYFRFCSFKFETER